MSASRLTADACAGVPAMYSAMRPPFEWPTTVTLD
jgi:hypothetical protein